MLSKARSGEKTNEKEVKRASTVLGKERKARISEFWMRPR